MRVPVLMFDFGNVVGFFDYSGMFRRFGLRLGMSAAELESEDVRTGSGWRWAGSSSEGSSRPRSSPDRS